GSRRRSTGSSARRRWISSPGQGYCCTWREGCCTRLEAGSPRQPLPSAPAPSSRRASSRRSDSVCRRVAFWRTPRRRWAAAGLPEKEQTSPQARTALASIHVAEGNLPAAADALAPVLDAPVPPAREMLAEAFLLDALVRDLLGDADVARSDIERALELAEPE